MKNKGYVFIAFAVYVLSILYLVLTLRVPGYGGDEMYFALPFLDSGIKDLHVFQFQYFGPLKTLATAPFFYLFGFNIFTLRLFSICVFFLGVVAWTWYLMKKKYWIAASATLLAVAFHFDLLFFAKVDINQPTFHNTLTICFFIVFLQIMEHDAKWWRSILFLFLSLVVMNNHLRNIWIINAFVVAMGIDSLIISGNLPAFLKGLRSLLVKKWPIPAGWLLSVSYFLYAVVHFRKSPVMEAAWDMGNQFSWGERLAAGFLNLLEYSVGGKVFEQGYAGDAWKIIIPLAGFFVLIFYAISIRASLANSGKGTWLHRILIITVAVVVSVFIQYTLTRSAIHSWHGNSLMLFIVLCFGLIVQSLYSTGKLKMMGAFLFSTVTVMAIITVFASARIPHPAGHYVKFKLATWNLQALDEVRQYISEHPGNYYVADWGIGRPLALEQKFRPVPGTSVSLEIRPLTRKVVSSFQGALVIRSTDVSLTAPNYSSKVMGKFDKDLSFVVLKSFYDKYGREVYQSGYFSKDQ